MTSFITASAVSLENISWIFAILILILIKVCGLKKNKRPREDPAANGGTRGGKRTTKRKSKKSKKKRTRRAVKSQGKKKIQRTEDDDVSAQRTGLIWPWLASVTISNEVSDDHDHDDDDDCL